MKQQYNLRQRAFVPFIGSIFFIIAGVKGLHKGIVMHQPWRIGLSLAGIVFFVAIIIMMAVTLLKKEKPTEV